MKAKPNKGHFALAEIIENLRARGKEVGIVTQNIDNLHSLNVLKQLRPLLLDPTVSIQNSAALALGRIANHS